MAFLLNSASISSSSSSEKTRCGFHIEPGTREKALLAGDSALKRFKSHKKNVHKLKWIGDVPTFVVVAGCCYEIYVKAVMRKEAQAAGKSSRLFLSLYAFFYSFIHYLFLLISQ